MKFITLILLPGLLLFGQERNQLRDADPVGLDAWSIQSKVIRTAPEGRVHEVRIQEDGLRFISLGEQEKRLVLNIKGRKAAAMRVHFEDFRLPEGGSVTVHGLDAQGSITRSAGPYTGTGPVDSGDFWSRAVPGEQMTIELRLPEETASLPFRIREVSQLDGVEEGVEVLSKNGRAETRVSFFRGMPVEHQLVDGYGIWEGDIILGRIEELEEVTKDKLTDRSAFGVGSSSYLWPGGVVPYTIDPAMPTPTRVTDAIAHWNANLAGVIRLIPRTTESAYVNFVRAPSAGTCSSYIGRTGSVQPVNFGDYCSTGNAIHETGHAIGLYHEHTRTDRNNYVQVITANIDPAYIGNFNIVSSGRNIGAYDYGSIMHYPAYGFSINGQPTIVTIPAGIAIGQRSGLSSGDIAGVGALYASVTPPPSGPVTVTFASSPVGRVLVVDGQSVTATTSFFWQPGSVHTISAPNATLNGVMYSFTKWNNNGAQTQTVTAPSSATTFTATYATKYWVSATPSDPAKGRVSTTPVSADGYYSMNSTVTVSAAAVTGNCFTTWTGIVPVSNPTVQLTITQPYTVTGNFQVGSVTFPTSVTAPAAGGLVPVSVNATSGCLWKASSNTNWITVVNGAGTASGVLQLQLNRNNGKGARTGTITVNGLVVTVTQVGR